MEGSVTLSSAVPLVGVNHGHPDGQGGEDIAGLLTVPAGILVLLNDS